MLSPRLMAHLQFTFYSSRDQTRKSFKRVRERWRRNVYTTFYDMNACWALCDSEVSVELKKKRLEFLEHQIVDEIRDTPVQVPPQRSKRASTSGAAILPKVSRSGSVDFAQNMRRRSMNLAWLSGPAAAGSTGSSVLQLSGEVEENVCDYVDDDAQLAAWGEYFERYGCGIDIIKTTGLFDIIDLGIPHRLRGRMWQVLSGSAYNLCNNVGYYEELLKANRNKTSRSLREIEKVSLKHSVCYLLIVLMF